uniref:Uncharacterized protein MANES_06G081300 n=1 Tax=Rhizophora mucronata TaxID=61149 RepID=A0A2P2JP93_RHIMU
MHLFNSILQRRIYSNFCKPIFSSTGPKHACCIKGHSHFPCGRYSNQANIASGNTLINNISCCFFKRKTFVFHNCSHIPSNCATYDCFSFAGSRNCTEVICICPCTYYRCVPNPTHHFVYKSTSRSRSSQVPVVINGHTPNSSNLAIPIFFSFLVRFNILLNRLCVVNLDSIGLFCPL